MVRQGRPAAEAAGSGTGPAAPADLGMVVVMTGVLITSLAPVDEGAVGHPLVAREDMIAGHVCFPAAGRHRQEPWSPPVARSGPGIGDHRPY
jgi:hypothetical protein